MLTGINDRWATTDLFWNDIHHSAKKDLNHIKNLNLRFAFFMVLLLITHGETETNPRPKSKKSKNLYAGTVILTASLHMTNYLY